jgi:hypothetical protein
MKSKHFNNISCVKKKKMSNYEETHDRSKDVERSAFNQEENE